MRTFSRRVIWLLTLFLTEAQAGEKGLIVFYDPDGNHKAILGITSTFNAYLQDNGIELRLQQVTSAEKLEELLKSDQVEYAIVSSSYLRERASLKPLLVPESKGDTYYRKILFDRASEPPGLSGKNIAATVGEGKNGQNVLAMLKRGGVAIDGAHVIPVAKDIDALLALSFGQVHAALVTQSSVDVLRRINPAAAASLRKIYETDKILRSPLCAIGNNRQNDQALIDALKRMDKDEKGKLAISSLGFDRWVAFASGEAK